MQCRISIHSFPKERTFLKCRLLCISQWCQICTGLKNEIGCTHARRNWDHYICFSVRGPVAHILTWPSLDLRKMHYWGANLFWYWCNETQFLDPHIIDYIEKFDITVIIIVDLFEYIQTEYALNLCLLKLTINFWKIIIHHWQVI